MNEFIVRLAVIAVCVVLIAAVAAYIIFGMAEDENSDIDIQHGQALTSLVTEEEAPVTETAAFTEAVSEIIPEETEETFSEAVTTAPPETGTESSAETSRTRTVITSRVRRDYDGQAVYIDMENILQLPELPVGCEITALTIALRSLGFDADKEDLARNYLPKGGNARYENGEVYKDSFFDYFIGDPFSRGYGCFAGAIEKAAKAYISDHGGGYDVINISGAHPDVLYDYLAAGVPVICWATDGMIEPEYYESWRDNATGEELFWYLNEHCFVLAGFNIGADLVTLNDPMKGIIDYNINRFETRYNQMYRQAIVIMDAEKSFIPASCYEHEDEDYASPLWTDVHTRTETTTETEESNEEVTGENS